MVKNTGWILSKKVIILGLILVFGISSVAFILGKNSTKVAEKIPSISKSNVEVQKISKIEAGNCDFISTVPLKLKTNSVIQAKKIQSSPKAKVKIKESKTEIDNCVFTVKSISQSMDNGYQTALEGNKLICISMKVENKGTEEQQMTSIMMFTLADSKQLQYNIALPEGSDSINGILSPNAVITGEIWFEVPKAEKKFKLTIRPSMPEQNTGILNIDTTGVTNTIDGRNKQEKKDTVIKSPSGKEVKIGNLEFKLSRISTDKVSSFGIDDEDYKLLNIEVIVENNETKEEQITSVMVFKLTDEEGKVYSMVLPENEGVNGVLKSKGKLCGKISFKVSSDKKDYKLEIKPWAMKQVKASLDIKL